MDSLPATLLLLLLPLAAAVRAPGANGAASNAGGLVVWAGREHFVWRRKRQTVGRQR